MDVKFYTVDEAADLLKTKTSTVRTYCREGKIPAIKVGRGYRIAEADLLKWLDKQRDEIPLSLEEEQKVLEAENRYRILFESASDAIAMFDVKGCLLLANPKFREISGYSEEETAGMHFSRFILPEDLPLVVERFMLRVAGEDVQSTYEVRGLHKNGQVVPLEINSSRLLRDGKPVGVHVMIRDVGERKQVDEAIRESQERYRTLFEDSPIALLEGDLSDVKRHMDKLKGKRIKNFREYFEQHPEDVVSCVSLVRFVDANKAALRLFEADSKERFEEEINTVLSSDLYDKLRESLVAFLAENKSEFDTETVIQTLGGEKRYVTLRMSVVPGYEETLSKAVISVIDVTARKEAEEALRKSEENYRSLVDDLDQGVFALDEKGFITFANRALAKIHGFEKPDELIGRNFMDFVPGELMDTFRKNFGEFVGGGGHSHSGEHAVIREDGGRGFLSVRAFPIIKMGRIVGVRGVVRDITERKRMEEEQKGLLNALQASSEGIAILDEDEKFVFMNQAFAKIHGCDPEEFIGKPWQSLYTRDCVEEAEREICQTARSSGRWEGHFRLRRKGGIEKSVNLSTTAVKDGEGKIINFVTITKEISR